MLSVGTNSLMRTNQRRPLIPKTNQVSEMQDDPFAGYSCPPSTPPTPYEAPPPFVAESELHQFFVDCSSHDWLYDYTDDHRVWTRGNKEHNRLVIRAAMSDKHREIFSAWRAFIFSGENFGLPKAPKPVWEDYRDTH